MSLGDIPFVGEIAGLSTAVCWSFCSIAFAFAGRRIGAMAVNQLRLPMAVALLSVSHVLLFGELWPQAATGRQVFWLTLSGVVGLSLGDLFLLHCFVVIGPRLGHILLTTWPVIAAVLAWPVLDETLGGWAILGIALTIGGVATVLSDRSGHVAWQPPPGAAPSKVIGVICGLLGATGQATGLVMAKLGMRAADAAHAAAEGGSHVADALDPLSATLLRMIAGMIGIWIISALRGQTGRTLRAAGDRRAMLYTFIGASLGPFIGVWLSLIAAAYAKVGIGATLMATPPILMLPLARIAYRDRAGLMSIGGTLIAVAGVACLFLGPGR
ncbi:MAG: DMT family transporter [Phycisphaerales bacterium]|nr:MAG: DMT family transporter [Phycisphaerales bacterium]